MPAVATVHLIAAARPNFMKVAPLWHALSAASDDGQALNNLIRLAHFGAYLASANEDAAPIYRGGRVEGLTLPLPIMPYGEG